MPRRIDRDAADRGPTDLDLPYERDTIASLVRIAAVLGSPAFQRGFGADGIPDDANAIPALYALATRGPRRPSTLAADLHVSAATVSRLLDKLAAAGLAERLPDPDDARAAQAHLTSSGREVAGALFRAGDQLIDELLAEWSSRDRDALGALLHRFADALADYATPVTDATPPAT